MTQQTKNTFGSDAQKQQHDNTPNSGKSSSAERPSEGQNVRPKEGMSEPNLSGSRKDENDANRSGNRVGQQNDR